MAPAIDASLRDIAAALSAELNGALDVSSLRWLRPPSDALVVDATYALLLDGKQTRNHSVLLVSNPQFPNAIAEAVSHAKTIAERLAPETGAHVLQPHRTGVHAGQSYALYPRLIPMSDNKLLRLAQKNIAAPRVAHWLQDVAQQSRQDAQNTETTFLAPLRYLAQEAEFTPELRDYAKQALTRTERNEADLFTIIEHGDFWSGNALFDPALLPGVTGSFRVIDWGGARLDGYAGIDLLRYCRSCFRTGARQSVTLMERYFTALNIPPADRALFPMAAMGRLGLNLDQFPKPRYVALAQDVFVFLKTGGFLPN